MLLELRGDMYGAEAAYRRADERGHAGAAFNLGVILANRGDVEEAEAAYRRAEARGHDEISRMAHAAISDLRGES
jgi:TPR repeat protein